MGRPLNKYAVAAAFGLLFAVVAWILHKAPLISDDFEFANYGYSRIEQVLPYVLYYGNGRLLGNIGGVLLINYPILCALVKAAVICGIIWILPVALGIKNDPRYMVISAVMLLLTNPDIFGQVFTWTSGFMNMVPPVLIMLSCIALIRNAERFSFGRMILIGILGVAGQLYAEHSTVIHILLALWMVIVYYFEKNPVRRKYALCWLLTAIAGAALMFAIPKVFYLENNRTAGYRHFHFSDLFFYVTKSAMLITHTISRCTGLLLGISIFALLLPRAKGMLVKSGWYLIYPAISAVFQFVTGDVGILKLVRYVLLYGGLILYVAFLVDDIWKYTSKPVRREMLVFLGVAATSVAPFLIISPFGERCIFLCYILLCMVLLRGLHFVLAQGVDAWFGKITAGGIALLLAGLVFLNYEFSRIDAYNTQRDTYIREQIAAGESEVIVYDIPSRYAFNTYLLELYYYREKQHDIQFEIVEYEVWESMTQNR